MNVGVRELKQNLSKYLELVAGGQSVVVTDRGNPKAILSPVPDQRGLERGIAEGWIRPPLTNRGLAAFRPVPGEQRVADLLDADRGDGE